MADHYQNTIPTGVSLKGETLLNTNPPNPCREEVWDVNFDPTIDSEIRKIRPVVFISSDGIGHLPIKLVSPITGWQSQFSRNIWHIRIRPNSTNGLTKVSAIDTLQIRGIDMRRFIAGEADSTQHLCRRLPQQSRQLLNINRLRRGLGFDRPTA